MPINITNYPAQIDTAINLPPAVDNFTPVSGAIFNGLKSTAKTREIECSISFEEYCDYIKEECSYCLGAFKKMEEQGGYFIDRLDNKVGYVINNCISCCHICNRIKGENFTYEETRAAVNAILMIRR